MPRRESMAVHLGPDNTYVARREVIDLIAEHSAQDLRHFSERIAACPSHIVDGAEDATTAQLQELAELHQRALTALLALIATRDPAEAFDVSAIPHVPA